MIAVRIDSAVSAATKPAPAAAAGSRACCLTRMALSVVSAYVWPALSVADLMALMRVSRAYRALHHCERAWRLAFCDAFSDAEREFFSDFNSVVPRAAGAGAGARREPSEAVRAKRQQRAAAKAKADATGTGDVRGVRVTLAPAAAAGASDRDINRSVEQIRSQWQLLLRALGSDRAAEWFLAPHITDPYFVAANAAAAAAAASGAAAVASPSAAKASPAITAAPPVAAGITAPAYRVCHVDVPVCRAGATEEWYQELYLAVCGFGDAAAYDHAQVSALGRSPALAAGGRAAVSDAAERYGAWHTCPFALYPRDRMGRSMGGGAPHVLQLCCGTAQSSHATIVAYAVHDRASFAAAARECQRLRDRPQPMCLVAVHANASETERAVTYAEGMALAAQHAVPFFECATARPTRRYLSSPAHHLPQLRAAQLPCGPAGYGVVRILRHVLASSQPVGAPASAAAAAAAAPPTTVAPALVQAPGATNAGSGAAEAARKSCVIA